jgi:hypothetical protein
VPVLDQEAIQARQVPVLDQEALVVALEAKTLKPNLTLRLPWSETRLA